MGQIPVRRVVLALALLAVAVPATAAQAADYGVATTTNMPIKMADGAILKGDVYTPTDPKTGKPADGPFPVILSETPYGKQFATTPAADLTGYEASLVKAGYIAAVVDVRGTGGSDGVFAAFGPAEQADSVQVVDWASKLPRSTGKVGMLGISYDGIDQLFAAAAVGKDSPLKAIFPIVAANAPFREIVASGGLFNGESDGALAGAYGALPLVNPFLQGSFDQTLGPLVVSHSAALTSFSASILSDAVTDGDRAYDEAFWRERSPRRVLTQIVANGIPAYLVGGLFDVFQAGEPLNYSGLQNAWSGRPVSAPMLPDQKVTGRYQLLMKSTYHSTIQSTAPPLAPIELRWFDHWLKGVDNGIETDPTPLHVYEPDGRVLKAARFPLPEATTTTLHLAAGNALSPAAPPALATTDTVVWSGASGPCDRSTEQYALGGGEVVFKALGGGTDPCGADVAPQSAAPAQITYDSMPMGQDETIAGPIDLRLFATSTTTDAEWIAKLSDVAPDGSAADVTQGALLGSRRAIDEAQTWRDAAGEPLLTWHPFTRASVTPLTPGALTRLDIDIRPTFTTIAKGHRLRLTLMTGQSPHLLPLPKDLPNLVGGVYAISRSAAAPSALRVPLATPAALDAAAAAAAKGSSTTVRCASARRFTIHLGPRHGRLRAPKVTVGGKHIAVKGGQRPTAVIDLRGRRQSAVRVVITGRVGRHAYRQVRTYHPCPHRA